MQGKYFATFVLFIVILMLSICLSNTFQVQSQLVFSPLVNVFMDFSQSFCWYEWLIKRFGQSYLWIALNMHASTVLYTISAGLLQLNDQRKESLHIHTHSYENCAGCSTKELSTFSASLHIRVQIEKQTSLQTVPAYWNKLTAWSLKYRNCKWQFVPWTIISFNIS